MSSDEKLLQVVVNNKLYTLCFTVIKLRGGKELRVPHVVTDRPPITKFQVIENVRGQLPLHWQVEVAKATVEQLGFSAAEAAQLAGYLKAQAEGLSRKEKQQAIRSILDALEESAS